MADDLESDVSIKSHHTNNYDHSDKENTSVELRIAKKEKKEKILDRLINKTKKRATEKDVNNNIITASTHKISPGRKEWKKEENDDSNKENIRLVWIYSKWPGCFL